MEYKNESTRPETAENRGQKAFAMQGQDGAGAGLVACRAMTSEELHRNEKSCVERLYGHVAAFTSFPSAQNYDNLALSLREMQTACMNGRKRVME